MAKKKKKLPRTIELVRYQTGNIKDIDADIAIKALTPGKRISKNGNEYWETRRNRSDKKGSNL